MGLEALSCAIARTIINYHALRTQTALCTIDSNHSIEQILNCSTHEIDKILEIKIAEATTENSSSRLTLLQYMHFGISLSEKARIAIANNTNEIETIKTQLVAFIQNIQRLLTTTGIISRTLACSTYEGKSLNIYYLNNPKATANPLIHELLKTIALSSTSDQATVRKNIELHCENEVLKHKLTLLEQHYHFLISKRKNSANSLAASEASEDEDDWESITTPNNALLENTTLLERINKVKHLIKQEQLNLNVITTQPTEADNQMQSTPSKTKCSLPTSSWSFFSSFPNFPSFPRIFSNNNHIPLDNTSNVDYP